MSIDLITVGNSCVDLFLPPHEQPPRGGITVIPSLDLVPGGNALNTAVAASRLEVRTAVAGTLGDDAFGRFLKSFFEAEGVDTSLLALAAGRASPATLVLNDASGERSFVHHPGTNIDFALPDEALEARPKIFHLAAPELLGTFWPERCLEAVERLRALGVLVSLDAFVTETSPEVVETHSALLRHCEIALPNDSEAMAITGTTHVDDAIDSMHASGVRVVVVKTGPCGAVISEDSGERREVPTEAVTAVDTCGAGDNFVGAFLAAWLRGKSAFEAAAFGCAMGTRCVQFRGSLTGTADDGFLESMRARLE